MNIALETSLAKLPMDAIIRTVQKYVRPLAEQLPDKRLERVVEEMILGILGGETPVVTAMARQNNKSDGESWATAKRIYRFLDNRHVSTGQLYEGLYQVGCQAVARERPAYLVAAIDPVNFEKPYAYSLEGVTFGGPQGHPARFVRTCPVGAWLSGHHGARLSIPKCL